MKKELSLKERLLRYFQKHHTDFIPSGEIQRLVMQYTTQTPRTCVRRLQEMAEEGTLEVKMVKGHANYRLKQIEGFSSREEMLRWSRHLVEQFDAV